jgi:hypothetical protein
MDTKKARVAYQSQKSNAKRRGIGFLLTFEQWLEWWGDDLEKRGVGQFSLQMQRKADTGPYELGNIRKGTPRDNAKTMGRMVRLHTTERADKDRIARQDALMGARSEPDIDPVERKHILQPWLNRVDAPVLAEIKELMPKRKGYLGLRQKVFKKQAKKIFSL